MHEADHTFQRRVVAQAQTLHLRDAERLTHRSKRLSLLDRVDAEIRFQVEVKVQHVLRIAGLFGDNRQDAGDDRIDGRRCGHDRSHWRRGSLDRFDCRRDFHRLWRRRNGRRCRSNGQRSRFRRRNRCWRWRYNALQRRWCDWSRTSLKHLAHFGHRDRVIGRAGAVARGRAAHAGPGAMTP